ncbi:MAG: RsmE family RNA methyltransferase [Bacteroidota bacterium]
MNLFYQPRLKENINSLEGDEAHHAKVLRLSVGDEILVTDGKGLLCEAAIASGGFKVLNQKTLTRNHSINLFVAPTKNSDRIEWLVEKATEIGIDSITLVECQRSERRKVNHDRLIKTAISAMKQSQQAWLPVINNIRSLPDIISSSFDQKFIAYVDHTNPDQLKDLVKKKHSYALLIGPEGDFTDDEVQLAIKNHWQKVSLGPTRLRTETAALMGCLTLVLANN